MNAPTGLGSPRAPIKLEAVATLCAAGECPTVYRTDRDTVVVQGYAIPPEDAGTAVPAGEYLVEIPLPLLALAASRLESH